MCASVPKQSQTFAVLVRQGVGKTRTTAVMVEEMLKAGLQVAAVDASGCGGLYRFSPLAKAHPRSHGSLSPPHLCSRSLRRVTQPGVYPGGGRAPSGGGGGTELGERGEAVGGT